MSSGKAFGEYEKWSDKHVKRFMAKVKKTNGCWEWTAYKNEFGYGAFGVDRRAVGAHRYAFHVFKEPLKKNLCVLHKCDNPPCVNPDHLFTGTQKDNAQDKVLKGRAFTNSAGEKNYKAKLSEKEVIEIRKIFPIVKNSSKIAKMYGVWNGTINAIVNRQTWKHLK